MAAFEYIYIIYTPNLGLGITVFDQEREQGRFRGSSEGARGSIEGALREQEGALWAQQVVTKLPKLYQWFRFYALEANLLLCSTCSRSKHSKYNVRHTRRANIANNYICYIRQTSKTNN